MFEPSWILAVAALVSLFMSFGTGVYTWHATKNRAQRKEIDDLNKRLSAESDRRRKDVGQLRDRITKQEVELSHLPDHGQVNEMRESIQRVRGDVGGVHDQLVSLGARIERIDNYLLNKDGK